jgi:hypothetical protein
MIRHKYGSSIFNDTNTADTAPLVLIGTEGATILVAPADEFLTTQVALVDSRLGVGPLAMLTAGLPSNYSYSVSVTLSSAGGVTATAMDWGKTLQAKYKQNDIIPARTNTRSTNTTAPMHLGLPANPLNEQLSYTTDLGAYFDYLAWEGQGPPHGETPENDLLNISEHFRAAGLPIKLFMLDIWWTVNDPRGSPYRHCMHDWDPIPDYFPKGLNWLATETGAGMMPYANYLCENSSYSTKNGGKWHTMNGRAFSGAVHGNVYPNESLAFWTERFTTAKEQYGMAKGAFWNDHMSENMDECVFVFFVCVMMMLINSNWSCNFPRYRTQRTSLADIALTSSLLMEWHTHPLEAVALLMLA